MKNNQIISELNRIRILMGQKPIEHHQNKINESDDKENKYNYCKTIDQFFKDRSVNSCVFYKEKWDKNPYVPNLIYSWNNNGAMLFVEPQRQEGIAIYRDFDKNARYVTFIYVGVFVENKDLISKYEKLFKEKATVIPYTEPPKYEGYTFLSYEKDYDDAFTATVETKKIQNGGVVTFSIKPNNDTIIRQAANLMSNIPIFDPNKKNEDTGEGTGTKGTGTGTEGTGTGKETVQGTGTEGSGDGKKTVQGTVGGQDKKAGSKDAEFPDDKSGSGEGTGSAKTGSGNDDATGKSLIKPQKKELSNILYANPSGGKQIKIQMGL